MVGQNKPNPGGLYDMHGNACEWVQDKWHSDYEDAPIDGSAWESGGSSYRVLRGGSWYHSGGGRSAQRISYAPDFYDNWVGFRLLMEL